MLPTLARRAAPCWCPGWPPDFTGVGPLGFTLTKTNWLDRHATGALTYDTYRLEELHPRAHGDTAVVTAHQTQITEGTYQGHPLPSQLRVTLALVRQTGRWRLTVAHMSFIAGTPGAPPIPDRP